MYVRKNTRQELPKEASQLKHFMQKKAEEKPMLKENRSLFKHILLCIVTLGIYGLYAQHKIAKDLNTACYEDGRHTHGFFVTFLLSLLTLGIYGLIWMDGVGNRISNYSIRHGMQPRCNGDSLLMWALLGSLLLGIGPIIALYKMLHGMNDVCTSYNREHLTQNVATLYIDEREFAMA